MLSKLLILFLLFVLPLVVIPFGPSFFEIPKVFLAEIAILILSFFVLFFKSDKLKSLNKLQLALTGGLVFLSIIHLFLYPNLNLFFGNGFRLQGVFLLWLLIIFSLISSKIEFKIPLWLPLISLVTLAASIPILGGNLAERAVGLLGEPNSLAAAILFIWPFVFLGSKKWPVRLISLILVSFVILSTGSRSGLIGFIVQLLFLGLLSLKMTLKKALIVGLGCLALSLVLPFIETNFSQSPFKLEDRAQIWQTALDAGLSYPVVGSGFGNIQSSLNLASQRLNNNVQYQVVDSSHNLFLDFWVQGGIIGLVLLASLIVISFFNLAKSDQKLELIAFIGILAVMLFNPVSVVILVYFWYLIAQGFKSKS